MRRATVKGKPASPVIGISIHALLAESDRAAYRQASLSHRISIHALLAESDSPVWGLAYTSRQFLSTLSLRRATTNQTNNRNLKRNFYPRSPCGERRLQIQQGHFLFHISIHALLAESDWHIHGFLRGLPISIHALLAESDTHPVGILVGVVISIHALLAESDIFGFWTAPSRPLFLSTLSLRRATNCTSIGRPKRLYFYPRSPCGERLCCLLC